MFNKSSRGLLLVLLTLLFVLVPFLFWSATWFGRRLDDAEIDRYLAEEKPRLVQHALAQIAERMIKGEMSPATAARWYPRVAGLADHRLTEIRSTAAWVMGQDNRSQDFHSTLLRLLHDPEVLVRRNAALSLVRFADASGRQEIISMLRSYPVLSPEAGILSFDLEEADTVNTATLLAKLDTGGKRVLQIRSPLPGRIEKTLVAEGQRVAAGDQIILLAPSPDQVWEALRALVLVGRPEDLPEIERFVLPGNRSDGLAGKIHQQACLTAQAIRNQSPGVRE